MTTQLDTTPSENAVILIPNNAEKDTLHRLRLFAKWLDDIHCNWEAPDLAYYRDYLLYSYVGRDGKPLAPSSVRAHLSTIRGRYLELLRNNELRDYLYSLTPNDAQPADRKAFVDETLTRLNNAIDPKQSSVQVITRQDRPDTEQLRLTSMQASNLMAAPGTNTFLGLRDTAIIALMLCTGIREAEVCGLNVVDLKQRLGGELALHVRKGKGRKERLIPYGELEFVLAIVDSWLNIVDIQQGAVFRGFYKGAKKVRPTPLTVRAVNQILNRYPIMIDGELLVIKPHDLRRTYARRLYVAGVDLLAIRDNLGHSDTKTTLGYIGTMNVDARRPPAIYEFDLNALKRAPAE